MKRSSLLQFRIIKHCEKAITSGESSRPEYDEMQSRYGAGAVLDSPHHPVPPIDSIIFKSSTGYRPRAPESKCCAGHGPKSEWMLHCRQSRALGHPLRRQLGSSYCLSFGPFVCFLFVQRPDGGRTTTFPVVMACLQSNWCLGWPTPASSSPGHTVPSPASGSQMKLLSGDCFIRSLYWYIITCWTIIHCLGCSVPT